MKIIYILKKGLHNYPPCLNQVLTINDMGIDLVVYHGKESDYINSLLDSRNITHYVLKSDNERNGRFNSVKKLINFYKELKDIIKRAPNDCVLWFGNAGSAFMAEGLLKSRKYVLSILELYDSKSILSKGLSKIINSATAVICCEKHRAAIMTSQYSLSRIPFVVPNKAYELDDRFDGLDSIVSDENGCLLTDKSKYKVLYQGLISSDRPLKTIASALSLIDDPSIYFVVMGKGDLNQVQEVKSIYDRTIYLGYIPSPLHMIVTRHANLGIANYDISSLNNIFCAPNKIYEYSKYGIPMIVSSNIGLQETVGDSKAAITVDFNDIECIVEAVKDIKNNSNTFSENANRFYDATNTHLLIEEIVEFVKENA